jgi:hypothetical protein
MNTTWRNIDFANMTMDVSPKNDRQDTLEWHIKDTDRRTLPLTADLARLRGFAGSNRRGGVEKGLFR